MSNHSNLRKGDIILLGTMQYEVVDPVKPSCDARLACRITGSSIWLHPCDEFKFLSRGGERFSHLRHGDHFERENDVGRYIKLRSMVTGIEGGSLSRHRLNAVDFGGGLYEISEDEVVTKVER